MMSQNLKFFRWNGKLNTPLISERGSFLQFFHRRDDVLQRVVREEARVLCLRKPLFLLEITVPMCLLFLTSLCSQTPSCLVPSGPVKHRWSCMCYQHWMWTCGCGHRLSQYTTIRLVLEDFESRNPLIGKILAAKNIQSHTKMTQVRFAEKP
jgi:hypothetical protein